MIRAVNTEIRYFDECNYIVYVYVGTGSYRVNIAAYLGTDDGTSIIDKALEFSKIYFNGK
jgi:hypothetical protein